MLTILLSAVGLAAAPASSEAGAVVRIPEPQITLDDLICPKAKAKEAQLRSRTRTSKLGELPPGDLHLAVVRNVGNCGISTVVRTRIGEGGR